MFNRILGKNLFSWDELDYEVTQGVSLIDGFNHDDNTSEGSGKSAVLNTLCWTLYGQIPKDAKIDDVIRHGQKSGAGQVNLENGYSVVRTRKPNSLYIVDPSGKKLKGRDAKETQQLIIRLIGMGFETFCQTLYFSQSYPKKFVTAAETDKGKILSEIQDLSIFDKAKKSAGDKARELGKELLQLEVTVEKDQERLEELGERVEDLKDAIEAFDARKQEKVTDLEKRCDILEHELSEVHEANKNANIKELEEQISHYSKMHKALVDKKAEIKYDLKQVDKIQEDYERQQSRLERELKRYDRQIHDLSAEIEELQESEGKCPVCGGELGDEHQAKVQEKMDKMLEKLQRLDEEKSSLEAQDSEAPEPVDTKDLEKMLKEVTKEADTVSEAYQELLSEKRDVDSLESTEKRLAKEFRALGDQLDKALAEEPTRETERLKEAQKREKELKKTLKENEKKLKDIAALHGKYKLLSKGFKDVKAYVFQSLLADLSKKSTVLAQSLFEVPIQIEFTNEAEDGGLSKILTNVTLDGVERPLGLLSGGQGRRVQLAVDLALSKIVANRSENPINFRAFDEPFKDLSETSMEKVVKLLEKLPGTTILIEHNSVVKSIVDRVFSVELKNGVTRNAS